MNKIRYEEMTKLLEEKNFFKVICGAGNEKPEEVRRIAIIYTLAGTKGIDISADLDIIKSCKEGIDYAFSFAKKHNIEIITRPFITVSVGMPGDHHVRKAVIHKNICIDCKLCIPSCPTDAIPESLEVVSSSCIGCGYCEAVCPKPESISYKHNNKELESILPKCIEEGAESIELHAGVADSDIILQEWKLISKINYEGINSMCLDRLHLSNSSLEKRVEMARDVSSKNIIIQADGYPMSGGQDDFNTTLQAVATADVVNKKFNKKLNKLRKKYIYKKKQEVFILLSGGTNSHTSRLAKQSDVLFNGVSIGSFARQIVKSILENDDFYNDENIKNGYKIAKKLIDCNSH